MAHESRHAATGTTSGPHLVLYDGTCGLCHGLIQFVLPRDSSGRFHFAPLQGALAMDLLARFSDASRHLDTMHVITNYRGDVQTHLVKSQAALFVLTTLGGPWRACAPLRLLPRSWRDRGYDLIARHRWRFFGRRDACVVPAPERRDRFHDSGNRGPESRSTPP